MPENGSFTEYIVRVTRADWYFHQYTGPREAGIKDLHERRRHVLAEQNIQPRSGQRLFSVMGQKVAGSVTALIIAANEADAEHYALHELSFISVAVTMLVSDSVYDTKHFQSSD
jgi:hypothetical protein